jgi:transposase
MPTSYRAYSPDQGLLLPTSLSERLAEDHLAYFISDAIEAMNLDAFHARHEGDGRRRQPFDPRMMVKVLIYGYATGVFSSRKIARKLSEDVAFRVLCANNFPAHRTIREFRQPHLQEFSALFVQVVKLAREAGLVKLGRLGIDGTKIKANIQKHFVARKYLVPIIARQDVNVPDAGCAVHRALRTKDHPALTPRFSAEIRHGASIAFKRHWCRCGSLAGSPGRVGHDARS